MILCNGDHEYALWESIKDHVEDAGNECEFYDAELVVSLEGYRGHYLGRDFIYEAIALEGERDPGDETILDRYEEEYDVMIEPGYTIAECVSDMVQEYEMRLFERGYHVEWNDGVVIVKIGSEINE